MSPKFWINLCIALCVLLFAVVYINRSKIHFIRKLMASRLRKFILYKLKADLESDVLKAGVLFDVERLALTDFLTKLSTYISFYESDKSSANQAEDLILTGQRAVNEINELKFEMICLVGFYDFLLRLY